MVTRHQLWRLFIEEIRAVLPIYLLPLIVVVRSVRRRRHLPSWRAIVRWLRRYERFPELERERD